VEEKEETVKTVYWFETRKPVQGEDLFEATPLAGGKKRKKESGVENLFGAGKKDKSLATLVSLKCALGKEIRGTGQKVEIPFVGVMFGLETVLVADNGEKRYPTHGESKANGGFRYCLPTYEDQTPGPFRLGIRR